MRKEWIKEYFSFSKRERNGIITLLILLVVCWILPRFLLSRQRLTVKELAFAKEDISLLSNMVDSASKEKKFTRRPENNLAQAKYGATHPPRVTELFLFDPNSATHDEWVRLGLKERTIKTILNFVSHGGKFYKGADLKKIYGMSDDDFERLAPYVSVKNANATAQHPAFEKKSSYEKKSPTPSIIEINTADTTEFISLPGIGSKLASRIIRYREKLGGFYSVNQLGEIYGLADSIFQKFKNHLTCDTSTIRKININTITLEELRSHPYFNYAIASAIIQFRQQHGAFRSLEDLRQIMAINMITYQKIFPYISIFN